MIKIRSKKISLLLVLAMLATLFVGVGTASATSGTVAISGAYTYVAAEDGVPAGTITVKQGEDYPTTVGAVDKVYAEVTLPDGVTFTDTSAITKGAATVEGSDSSTYTVSVPGTSVGDGSNLINLSTIALDVDSSFTGSITASVRVWGSDIDGATVFDVTNNATIAKIKAGNVTVTAKTATDVQVGSKQLGAKVTIKGDNPGALAGGDDIFYTIENSGVTFDAANGPQAESTISGTGMDATVVGYTGSNKTLHLTAKNISGVLSPSLSIVPLLKVLPGATGDVKIKVSGDDITTTEVTVASVGTASVTVTVDKADKDTLYLGQNTENDQLQDVKITLDPSSELKADDYFTMTLPQGLKWADYDMTNSDHFDYLNDEVTKEVDDISDNASVNDIYNDGQSLWVDCSVSDANIVITGLAIVADSTATVGDLNITFGGVASGTYKVATVAAPFTVATTPVQLPVSGSSVAGSDITITEAGAGALITTDGDDNKTDSEPQYMDITLPMGVTFDGTPTVKVTDGDLGNVSASLDASDDSVLQIAIGNQSNMASTITISNVSYNVDNRAAVGDITAKVGKAYNLASSNALANVKIGTIVDSAAVQAATFVIGASTYTVNGTEVTAVAPSFISNSRSYLAIRDIAHVLGIADNNILWDGTSNTVTLMKGSKVVQLKVNSNIMYINGAAVTMDTTVQNVNGRTFLPAAFLAQAFGATATWDGTTNTVTIK